MTAAKSPSKPADEKPDTTRTTSLLIDYSALETESAEMPAQSRSSMLDGTPFVAWLTESRDKSEAKAVTVPESARKQTEYLIRGAAAQIGAGVRMAVSELPGKKVKITFQAKTKRAHYTPEQRAERAAAAEKAAADKAAKAKK